MSQNDGTSSNPETGAPADGQGLPSDGQRASGAYSEIYSEDRALTADEELRRLASPPESPIAGSEQSFASGVGLASTGAAAPVSDDGLTSSALTERDRLRDELHARDEHVRSLREQVGQLEQRLDNTRISAERLDNLKNENRRVEREAEKLRMLTDARELERDELASRLRTAEAEKAQLRRQVENLHSSESDFDSERDALRQQVQQLEAELIRSNRDHAGRRSELDVATEDRNDLVRSVAALKSDRAEDLARVNELEGLVERRDNELRHLKKKLARAESDIERSAEATTTLDVRTAERDKLQRRVHALETELTAQTTEAGASRKALELLAARTTERDLLERQVIDLERALNESNATATGSAEAVRMLEARTRERDDLERRLVSLEAELSRERAQNVEWRGTADLVASTTTERDKLRRRVSVLESELEAIGLAPAGTTGTTGPPVDAMVLARLAALESQLVAAEAGAPTSDAPAAALVAAPEVSSAGGAGSGELDFLPGHTVTPDTAVHDTSLNNTGFQDLVGVAAPDEGSLWPAVDEVPPHEAVRPGVQAMYEQALSDSEMANADAPAPKVAAEPPTAFQSTSRSQSEALADALFARSPSSVIPGVDTVVAFAGNTVDRPEVSPPASVDAGFADAGFVVGGQAPPTAPVPAPTPPAAAHTSPVAAPTPPAAAPTPPAPTTPAPSAAVVPALANRRSFGQREARRNGAELTDGALLIIDGDGVLNETRFPERFIDAVNIFAGARNLEVQLVFDGARLQPNPQLGSRDRVQVRFTQGVSVSEVVSRMLAAVDVGLGTVVASDSPELAASIRRTDGTMISTADLIGAVVG